MEEKQEEQRMDVKIHRAEQRMDVEIHRAEDRMARQKEDLARADDEIRRRAAEIVEANKKPLEDLDIDLGE